MNIEKTPQVSDGKSENHSEKHLNGEMRRRQKEFVEPENFINKVIDKGRVVGEGGKGVVLQISFEKTESVGQQEKEGNFSEDSRAVKLLKVYTKGAGRREYELQNKIADLVNQSNKAPCASIPRGYHYEDASLSQSQKNGLEQRTGHKFHQGSAELFMMDYINADELYERLMKEVVWRAHSDISKDKLARLSSQEMEKRAERAVGFQSKDTNSENLKKKDQDEFRSLVTKMYNFLKKKDVEIKDEITEQIENTISVFSENDLQHNDLHERNIMIDGPLFDDSPSDDKLSTEVYIIDFGEMTEQVKGRSSSMEDDVVLNRLRKNFSSEKPPAVQLEEELVQINQDYAGLSGYEKMYEEQKTVLNQERKVDKAKKLKRRFQKNWSTDKQQMKIFFAALFDKVRSSEDGMSTAIDFTQKLEQELTSHWQRELISNIKELFSKKVNESQT